MGLPPRLCGHAPGNTHPDLLRRPPGAPLASNGRVRSSRSPHLAARRVRLTMAEALAPARLLGSGDVDRAQRHGSAVGAGSPSGPVLDPRPPVDSDCAMNAT